MERETMAPRGSAYPMKHFCIGDIVALLVEKPRKSWTGNESLRAKLGNKQNPRVYYHLSLLLTNARRMGYIDYDRKTRLWHARKDRVHGPID
jgi:hypothetical protein